MLPDSFCWNSVHRWITEGHNWYDASMLMLILNAVVFLLLPFIVTLVVIVSQNDLCQSIHEDLSFLMVYNKRLNRNVVLCQ